MVFFACSSPMMNVNMPLLACHGSPNQAAGGGGESFCLGEYVGARIKRINKSLAEVVPLRCPLSLHESMRHTLLAPRCRRACAVLSLASCGLLGGLESSALPSACAAEMLVASASIVDDLPCMDDDRLRLGLPANHLIFGEDVAVLAASALVSLSFHHLVDFSVGVVPADRVARTVAELAGAFGPEGLSAGQVVDMESEGKDVSLRDVTYIHERKTGMIFGASAACGAIAGGGDEAEVATVRRYARSLGLAYQVVDDILDVTSTPEVLGKAPGRDLECGKATYPKLVGVDGAREFARETVELAVEELAGFDPVRAAPLYHLARSVIEQEGKSFDN